MAALEGPNGLLLLPPRAMGEGGIPGSPEAGASAGHPKARLPGPLAKGDGGQAALSKDLPAAPLLAAAPKGEGGQALSSDEAR